MSLIDRSWVPVFNSSLLNLSKTNGLSSRMNWVNRWFTWSLLYFTLVSSYWKPSITDFEVLKKLSIIIRSYWALFERIRKLSRSRVVYFIKAVTSKLIFSLKAIIYSVLVRILVSLGPISLSILVISRLSSLLL